MGPSTKAPPGGPRPRAQRPQPRWVRCPPRPRSRASPASSSPSRGSPCLLPNFVTFQDLGWISHDLLIKIKLINCFFPSLFDQAVSRGRLPRPAYPRSPPSSSWPSRGSPCLSRPREGERGPSVSKTASAFAQENSLKDQSARPLMATFSGNRVRISSKLQLHISVQVSYQRYER